MRSWKKFRKTVSFSQNGNLGSRLWWVWQTKPSNSNSTFKSGILWNEFWKAVCLHYYATQFTNYCARTPEAVVPLYTNYCQMSTSDGCASVTWSHPASVCSRIIWVHFCRHWCPADPVDRVQVGVWSNSIVHPSHVSWWHALLPSCSAASGASAALVLWCTAALLLCWPAGGTLVATAAVPTDLPIAIQSRVTGSPSSSSSSSSLSLLTLCQLDPPLTWQEVCARTGGIGVLNGAELENFKQR